MKCGHSFLVTWSCNKQQSDLCFSEPNLSSPAHPLTESVYDLLPKELQLQPSSTQTDPSTMSQKSGGEAGPPPSAALASGELPPQSMKTVIWDQFPLAKLFPKTVGVKKLIWPCISVWGQLHPFTSF